MLKILKRILLKKPYFMLVFLPIMFYCTCINSVYALNLDKVTLTIPLESSGKTVTLTPEQAKRGKRLFNSACASCHNGGITKTNPNIGLDPESLDLATPQRNNVEALVDYMKDPTSYDGTESIAELHPSIKSAEIFPKMRNLTDDDLFTIAGHILVQPKILSEKWGGGKLYY